METLETPPRIAVVYHKNFNCFLDIHYQRKGKWRKEEIELDKSFASIFRLETIDDGVAFLFYPRQFGTMGHPKISDFPKVCHLSFDVDKKGRLGGSMKIYPIGSSIKDRLRRVPGGFILFERGRNRLVLCVFKGNGVKSVERTMTHEVVDVGYSDSKLLVASENQIHLYSFPELEILGKTVADFSISITGICVLSNGCFIVFGWRKFRVYELNSLKPVSGELLPLTKEKSIFHIAQIDGKTFGVVIGKYIEIWDLEKQSLVTRIKAQHPQYSEYATESSSCLVPFGNSKFAVGGYYQSPEEDSSTTAIFLMNPATKRSEEKFLIPYGTSMGYFCGLPLLKGDMKVIVNFLVQNTPIAADVIGILVKFF